jgi:hypothetical protein
MEQILKNLGQGEILLILGTIVYYWVIVPSVKKLKEKF